MTDPQTSGKINRNLRIAVVGTFMGGILAFGSMGYLMYNTNQSYGAPEDLRRVQQINLKLSKPKYRLENLLYDQSVDNSTEEVRNLRTERDSLMSLESYKNQLEIHKNKVGDVNTKTNYLILLGGLTFLSSLSLGVYNGNKLYKK